ncbi:disease resistance protein Roq1-like [Lotus japonicus]|uniref:disease resistance protein Roq1-like n=1 Tax=Lotus japonicus TaxID=34305 RepID=UPI00258E103B|nr:disease resistance protein Roq1-like [Lotus japonicus]
MAVPLSSSSSSSSSSSTLFTYDVFISFRGYDTRHGFTGNLYKALCDKGIRTFFDDKELERGEEITPVLVKAIAESRIAIPVFSASYASTSFGLDELVTIIDRIKNQGRLVLPVFYDVDPSKVRHQTGSYKEDLDKHQVKFEQNKEKFTDNMERLKKWKTALSQAANLSGYHFNLGDGYEYEFIGNIVKEVSNKINRVPLFVAKFPVGLDSKVLEVISLLDVASDDGVCLVGVYGFGGVGKITLARAVYNSIFDNFECLCFLHNVRENSSKLERLQEKLLSKTVELAIDIGDVNEGIPIIKQRLQRKKVLLVLDDVDQLKQLQAMVGGIDWFGPGSRVIITTRDKNLLTIHEIERTYEVNVLNEKEALDLLTLNAFKKNKVDSSYKDVINRAVTYASGLPLALEVIGSNLFGKNIAAWNNTLSRYERIPDKDIQQILKVNFDALEEEEKNVFLDIACCFKGHPLVEVEHILHAHHGECMKPHIGILVEKSLVKISSNDEVTLHDLIEDMGKEIVRIESTKEPEKRSRLWSHEDILQVLEDETGTRDIEIICLDFSLTSEEEIEWNGKGFENMKNLRTLIIRNAHFSKAPEHLPNSFRVLECERYPSKYLPSNFHAKKLAICKLPRYCFVLSNLAGLLKTAPRSP